MKKILFVLLLIWFWPVIIVQGQTASPEWILFSEFSPTPRSGGDRILPNSKENFHMEWRNRIGKMVSGNTAVGLIVNYRQYNNSEAVTYSLDPPSFSYSYDYNIKNNLWGTGAFITRFVQITNRFQLQATAYGLYEMGNGNYNMTLESYNCPNCFTSGINFGVRTGDIENLTIKERNFFAGLDLGISYAVNKRIFLLSGINLVQYENYSISEGNRISPALSTPALYRQLDIKGSSFTTAIDRPIFHLGIMLVLNK